MPPVFPTVPSRPDVLFLPGGSESQAIHFIDTNTRKLQNVTLKASTFIFVSGATERAPAVYTLGIWHFSSQPAQAAMPQKQ